MGTKTKAAITAITAVLMAVAVLTITGSSTATPGPTTNEVIIKCAVNTNQQVDPILKFDSDAASSDPDSDDASAHLHTPSGANDFSDHTTVSDMMASTTSTSCDVASDHTEFWFPTVMTPLDAPATIKSQSYFLTNTDYTIPTSTPVGLRFITGDSTCALVSCAGNVIYQCTGSQATTHTIPTSCSLGNGFNEAIYSQNQCWDGQSLGAGMGDETAPNVIGTNLVKGTNGVCPSGFTPIPGVGWTIHVGQDGVGGHLSSDTTISNPNPGTTGHLDFVFGQGALEAITASCLNPADPGTGGTLQTCTEKPNGSGGTGLYALDSTGHYTVFVTN